MKELWPYFRLLKPVRWQFVGAVLCALIYGVSSGFGLPFMTQKVFPLIFSSEGRGVELFTMLGNGRYHPVPGLPEALDTSFFFKNGDGSTQPVGEIRITPDRLEWRATNHDPFQKVEQTLFVETEDGSQAVKGGLFKKDSSSQAYLPLSDHRPTTSKWTLIGAVLLLPLIFVLRGASSFLNIYLISYCGLHVLEQIYQRQSAHG